MTRNIKLSVRLDEKEHRLLKLCALDMGVSQAELVRWWLEIDIEACGDPEQRLKQKGQSARAKRP
jgi:hypothetical protein